MDLAFALRAFVRTIDRGSMTAAARDLGLSQPAVSKLVRNLEAHAGARLIERSSRALRPTEQGRALYEASGEALSTIDAAIESVRGGGSAVTGDLRLHAPVCLGESRLTRMILDFQALHPSVAVTIKLENQPVDLVRENFDLDLRMSRPVERNLVQRRIGSVRRVLVASAGYLASRGPIDRLAELEGRELIVTETVLARDGTLGFVRDGVMTRVPVRPILTTNNPQVVLDAARMGRGIATAQFQMVAGDLAAGQLVRVLAEDEILPTELYLTYPSARYLRPAVRAFVDFAVPELQRIEGID